MASNSTKSLARYFGQTSPRDLKELQHNASKAKPEQLAKAAGYLQKAFTGQYYAWFGGWALNLRGSRRETTDLDLLVLAADVGQVRTTLAPYSWAILSYWEITGSIQERMFVDISEGGQLVAVDVVLSGKLDTPNLTEPDSFELIHPSFQTPQGSKVPVIELTWQVEGKLGAWISRRKDSDLKDLIFLFMTYGETIRQWSEHLKMESRVDFYEVYKITMDSDVEACKEMRETLCIAQKKSRK
ncbi:hypothetical protein F4678DRAFT_455742 [Xylaria arbuscula]|nr:hypothetical protein F4678DRAFT_455742 [Xylaria arbuscula]